MANRTSCSLDNPIIDTLLLALDQCREQVQKLAERTKTIESLRQENEQLRRELEQHKKTSDNHVEARFQTQFQNAFMLVAEKDAEIARLKEKIHNVRAKVKRMESLEPVSSSRTNFANIKSSSPRSHVSVQDSPTNKESKMATLATPASGDTFAKPAPRKRQRSPSPPGRGPLQEVSPNIDLPVSRPNRTEKVKSRKQDRSGKAVAAIPELAEDGDEDLRVQRKTEGHKAKKLSGSVYHRLEDLLDGRGPASPVLLGARSNSPLNGGDSETHATPIQSRSPRSGLPTPSTENRRKRPRSSLASSKSAANRGPEDEEPYRARPLHRLGLTHFKLNPSANAGLEYAYNEVVRGQDRRALSGCTRSCCSGAFRALANTLPKLPAAEGQQMTDDDLLLGYLGHGSEERIRTMTPLARENLVHEARTKIVADAYGKMHRDVHERGRSPPGFWRTDMPGSQEHREDRELAHVAEREEVGKRYNEAMKEGGRWMFADE